MCVDECDIELLMLGAQELSAATLRSDDSAVNLMKRTSANRSETLARLEALSLCVELQRRHRSVC